jgi:hypothetical protein
MTADEVSRLKKELIGERNRQAIHRLDRLARDQGRGANEHQQLPLFLQPQPVQNSAAVGNTGADHSRAPHLAKRSDPVRRQGSSKLRILQFREIKA